MGQILGMGPERNMGFNLYCCLCTGTSYPFYPLLKGKTTWCYNLLSVVSILSIIMTWFGVNYYLSGLHSYGKTEGGDLLLWIWGAGLCVVLALALFARRRLKKYS